MASTSDIERRNTDKRGGGGLGGGQESKIPQATSRPAVL